MDTTRLGVKERGEMYRILRDEINEVLGLAPVTADSNVQRLDVENLSGARRRLFVRSVFSFIEAMVYALKQEALTATDATARLSDAERLLCGDATVELNDRGEAAVRSARIRFLDNFKFAFAMSAKVVGKDNKLQAGQPEWQFLTRSVKVRDRLTHPKGVADLTVSDAEFGDCLVALVWVESLLLGALLDHAEWEVVNQAKTDETLASFIRSLPGGSASLHFTQPMLAADNSSPE